jgi:purine-cytosine permease-like protein
MTSQEKEQTRSDRAALAGNLTTDFVGSLIMMWGVINLVHNFLTWRSFDSESSHWWVTICFVVLTGVIPLVVGLRILAKASSTS